MKIIEPGHIYQLQHLDGSGAGVLVFVNREPGTEHEGTQTQDVLRVLIDRTMHCNECLPWDGNDKIIHHLRMALALHESRALERKTEKGVIEPEKVATGPDGHFRFYGDKWVGPNHPTPKSPNELENDCTALDPNLAPAKSWGPRTLQTQGLPSDLGEPRTTDYCKSCGQSPESAAHGPFSNAHEYVDPRIKVFRGEGRMEVVTPNSLPTTSIFLRQEPDQSPPYKCNVPMCGDSGVCEECRKRGAR